MDPVTATVSKEFSDAPDAPQITRILLRLLIAAALGGVLGLEREHKGKAAGIRTHMLVSMAAIGICCGLGRAAPTAGRPSQ